ncbi:F-box/LRR-repeat protein 13-like [Neltuma alba]|uniref:F-box/LRR-repeat protein 13-like n=1 Tax=Neltuma alba TaxID=207710 RepID=UPI0010A53967|nr:F-box/LRR-repeat protein 13-like [Prosopis alba]XP_028806305.1 F-box/LRR-repeat protein 13-like [Prosopis alba]
MEESVSTNKMLRTEEVKDRISDLPDSLLLHILSFLPAKEAVATSLLSKRWRPLWPYLPTLDLRRQDFERLTFFQKFADNMLKFADLKSVKKFVLWFGSDKPCEYVRPRTISKWINVVIGYKIEYLELHLKPYNGDYELPSGIFTSNSVKVLNLSTGSFWWTSGVTVGTLSHVNLPLLEALHLENVKFLDFRSLGMLLSSCPLLKHLVVKILHLASYCPLDIGRLKHLVTAEVPQSLLPLEVLSNAAFLCFRWHNFSQINPDIPTFHNLIRLEFEYYSHDWKTILKYLQSCPKLEILVIDQFACSESLEPTIIDVPQCVSSTLKEFHLGSYRGKNCEFELARFIMKNALVLRIISVSRDFCSRVTWKNKILKKISSCPMSSVNCRLLLK